MSLLNRQRHSKRFLNFLGKCFPEAKAQHQFGSHPAQQGQHWGQQPRMALTVALGGPGGWSLAALIAIANNQEELQKRKQENNPNTFEIYTIF